MSKKRGSYRSRRTETKKRADDRRRESGIYHEEEKKVWVSLKGKQVPPPLKIRPRYLTPTYIDPETKTELERAVSGDSLMLDRYQAARIIAADAIERRLIREAKCTFDK
jgi:hypothetical protein